MLFEGPRTPDLSPFFGLTGGIACGKSTVAGYFEELGAYILDADRTGHELMQPGQAAYGEIVRQFGPEVLAADGRIDRQKLGPRVFADPDERQRLNSILHPRIIARMYALAAAARQRNPRAVVIMDAPLLYETGMEAALRKVIVVWCRPEQQLERLVAKTGMAREEAERRIQAQMPLEEKRRRADLPLIVREPGNSRARKRG
jgi:dephospho-CoA kinase